MKIRRALWSAILLGIVFLTTIIMQIRFTGKDHNILETIAGGIGIGYSGDGGPAIHAALNSPHGMTLDTSENLYFADTYNHTIRKVDKGGIITTVAGDGKEGSGPDGMPAVKTRFRAPFGVAADSSGNLYIADWGNNLIRKVNSHGNISTVAGSDKYGFRGDGGKATSARLAAPVDIAIDAGGNLYIADQDNGRIRKVDTHGIITTVAGTGRAIPKANTQSAPPGLNRDPSTGAEIWHPEVKPTAANPFGMTSRTASMDKNNGDKGLATRSALIRPTGIAVDGIGNIFIAEAGRIRKVDIHGIITTVAGGGTIEKSDGMPATKAYLTIMGKIALDKSGNLYIVEWQTACVRMVDTRGIITTIARNPAGSGLNIYPPRRGDASRKPFVFPDGIAIDKQGRIYISDTNVMHIVRLDSK